MATSNRLIVTGRRGLVQGKAQLCGKGRRAIILRRCLGFEISPPLISVDVPTPRAGAGEPTVVPIVHSPAYYLQLDEENLLSEVTERQEIIRQDDGSKLASTSFEENPVDWMLTSTDQMLNEMERNPNEATEAIWKLSNSPMGKGTAAGVRAAAKVTIKAGQEALKIAVPIGTWALKEGMTAVVKLMSTPKNKK